MPATRRSARIASSQGSQASSPPQSQTSPQQSAGSKRKSEGGSSPSAKRGKKAVEKEQKTIEETLPDADPSEEKTRSEGEKAATTTDNAVQQSSDQPPPASKPDEQTAQTSSEAEPKPSQAESKPSQAEPKPSQTERLTQTSAEAESKSSTDAQTAPKAPEAKPEPEPNQDAQPEQTSAKDEPKPSEDQEMPDADAAKEDDKPTSNGQDKTDQTEKPDHEKPASTSQHVANNDNAVVEDARTDEEPSSILEKGVIYFVYRGRVGIDSPSEVQDIARSYMVLRPIPTGAKLGEGPIGDDHTCRLIAIPKKVLPLSGKDRWIGFVEKAKTTMKDLKDNFFAASDYETQTAGTRHSPAAVPAAEGVYAITSTGRESHLAYIVTLPKSLGEVQNDLGLRERGSFIVSVKNPKYPGPANADIGKDPGYTQEIQDTFRNLRWAPLRADMFDFEGCQFLLVGESNGLESATKTQEEDQKQNKMEPKEELETLGSEDAIRVKHLHNEDAVFKDLGTDAKSYPGLQTTW